MRNVSKGLGEAPTGQGVGREAAVHDGDGRGQPLVAQVAKVPSQLGGGQHALVDQYVARAGRGVDVHGVFDHFARAEQRPLQIRRWIDGGLNDELLQELRFRGPRTGTEQAGVHGHVTPTGRDQANPGQDLVDGELNGLNLTILRNHPVGEPVLARLGHGLAENHPDERVGHLDQNPRAVSGVRVRTRRAAMLQVLQDREGVVHRGVRGPGGQVRHHTHAAGVVFESGIVE